MKYILKLDDYKGHTPLYLLKYENKQIHVTAKMSEAQLFNDERKAVTFAEVRGFSFTEIKCIN